MNDLITDVKVLYEETLNNLKNSKANNTIRAYKSDFRDFGGFCAKNGLKSLPANPNKIIVLSLNFLIPVLSDVSLSIASIISFK